MKILHIITQKPNSTGSGVYMCGMIDGFEKIGYEQAVISGIDKEDDRNCFNNNIGYYPVIYNSDKLPFNVVGMSDVMPYNSTKYKDMDKDMVNFLKDAFKKNIQKALNEFEPDLIICHHLYLLTSYVRELIKDIKVVSICHGTCLRQLQSHDLEKEYIMSNIKKLDLVFSLHDEQRQEIIDLFNIDPSKVLTLGSGYDKNMFFNKEKELSGEYINITYAGKIAKAKGVESLIKSLDYLNYNKDFININIVGDGNNRYEYEEIVELANKSYYNINFLGKVTQNELSSLFRESHIFVLPSFFEGLPLVVIESLACGCNVVTTDIAGVKDWIGNDINNSGKIAYIDLPKMKSIGVPYEDELLVFEESLSNSLETMISSILNDNTRNKYIDMSEKTWMSLCSRLDKNIVIINELLV
ncbi:MAG: glycosyltransferase family 4 protein [Romboutsia sp.]|uniref:glycosyltransferase family 4 protein n=1 Tax=Romboutsia sp. TaxID=1965302 RepID=UPI003F3C899A